MCFKCYIEEHPIIYYSNDTDIVGKPNNQRVGI